MGLDLPIVVNLKRILTGVGRVGDDILTLGVQQFFLAEGDQEILKRLHRKEDGDVTIHDAFKSLGFNTVRTLDISDYEGAEILHDLNLPVPPELQGRYSCVFDGGTLEHVFDFPRALNNAKTLVKTGGLFIGVSPVNNACGHGFYQLSPELIFRTFSPEYGFKVEGFYVYENAPSFPAWKVKDPKSLGRRVEFSNAFPLHCIYVARKLDSNSAAEAPQQSDYVDSWEKGESNQFRYERGGRRASGFKTRLRGWSLSNPAFGSFAYRLRLTSKFLKWVLKGTTLSAYRDFERVDDRNV